MQSNFLLTDNINADDTLSGYRIINIDGDTTQTLRNFYEAIAKALDFPDYFGYNLDSLDEFLNDLSWLEEKKLAVYIFNSENFIIKERNSEKLDTLFDLLDATCEDWKWEEENEGDVPKKSLIFVFSKSQRIMQLLENKGIIFILA